MYSNEDFENFYVRYKAEGLPRNMSIKTWCLKQKMPWNLFNKWYKDTRHRIVPVEVEGRPEDKCYPTDDRPEPDAKEEFVLTPAGSDPVRIMVDIRMTNGMQIRQRNLSYDRLKNLVEKLEGLC